MSFPQAVRSGLANYANFHGRASRPAYWWWALFALIAVYLAKGLDMLLGLGPKPSTPFALLGWGLLGMIVNLGLLLPSWAVFVRRLHDTDRSGWWALLSFLPVIGWIVLLYFLVIAGTPGPNHYGPLPRGTSGVRYVHADAPPPAPEPRLKGDPGGRVTLRTA